MRGPKRRDIGHGALAQRALEAVIPKADEFPYTIRIVSETLESNGSSSMGSVCGSTLALMDAGVPIKEPVSGIAMGLVKEGDDYVILTDIQGAEDHLGDMDFKVAGTRNGITALQMDIKITGVSREIMERALSQAREARIAILDRMLQAIAEPRAELAGHAPRISTIQINPEYIGMVIGKGGETIRSLEADTRSRSTSRRTARSSSTPPRARTATPRSPRSTRSRRIRRSATSTPARSSRRPTSARSSS